MTVAAPLHAMFFSCALAIGSATVALAHHGWAWTEDGFFELEGVIAAIYLGNPHATIDVDVEGEIWKVELAPPRQTQRAGFTEEAAEVGDEVTAIGNRSRDATDTVLKAVRIIVNGQTYDVYPNRVPAD